MRIPLPKVAKLIRRAGFRIACIAKFFEPRQEEETFAKKLLNYVDQSHKLAELTDEQFAKVVARVFDRSAMGSLEDTVLDQIVDRLLRSRNGANTWINQEHPYRGPRVIVKFINHHRCQGCARFGYVDAKEWLCPWCLAWKLMASERFQKMQRPFMNQKF